MITVVLLNYRRPDNIPIIVSALRDQTVKARLWLWNNSSTCIPNGVVDMQVVSDSNLGCWPRWFLASYVPSEFVLMLDDDILPTSSCFLETALKLINSQQSPRTLVGSEGVVLGRPNQYWPSYSGRLTRDSPEADRGTVHLKSVVRDTHVDIVKGRCVVVRVASLRSLPMSPPHRDMCDDIAVSLLLADGNPRVHLVAASLGQMLQDLPDRAPDVALSHRTDWRKIRNSATAHYTGIGAEGAGPQ